MKKIILAAFSVVLLLSCEKSEGPTYDIVGKWSGGDGEKVYLGDSDIKTKESNYIDSAVVKNGEFVIAGKLTDITTSNIITKYGQQKFLLSDELTIVDIKVKETESRRGGTIKIAQIEVTGGVEQQLYTDYNSAKMTGAMGMMLMALAMPKALEENNKAKQDSLTDVYVQTQEMMKSRIDSVYLNNLDTYMAAYVIYDTYSGDKTYKELMADYGKLSERVRNSFMGVNLLKKLDQIKATSVGEKAPDFTAPNPEGKEISLSSLKGKYVLIDFWASWCGPCIAELPNVKSVYKDYKDRGFEIVSISLDEDRERWLKSAKDHGINWINISNVAGWNCPIAKAYNVTGIPAMFLISPDGVVLSSDLRGEKLREQVSKNIK